jgi:hypothetical protein
MVIISIRMRWVRHVARMGEMRNYIKFQSENLEEDHLGDLGVNLGGK